MPPQIAVLQHISDSVIALDTIAPSDDIAFDVIKLGVTPKRRVDLGRYRGLMILGGPMSLTDMDAYPFLRRELALIKAAMAQSLPILGICLGAQLIALALGGQVYRHTHTEIGWYALEPTRVGRTDPLFAHFGAQETVFQWHSDTFTLPRGAQRLAGANSCKNQAFRYGERVYGVQFHPEMTATAIASWLTDDIGRAELAQAGPAFNADRIMNETRQRIGAYRTLANQMFSQFVALTNTFGNRNRVTSIVRPKRGQAKAIRPRGRTYRT